MKKRVLYSCAGGDLVLPAQASLLADRGDGGNLVVNPPRRVWERSALDPQELTAFGFLVSAAGQAMLETLPQLEGGCINYWEAGNWALNEAAEPKGPKTAREHRSMHLHLIGRSRFSKSPNHVWGESPVFPMYADRLTWARDYAVFTPDECAAIVARIVDLLAGKFAMTALPAWERCAACLYPTPSSARHDC
jgi:diadenosine tetraphosphate (Ap4A) HIT family hydrolase